MVHRRRFRLMTTSLLLHLLLALNYIGITSANRAANPRVLKKCKGSKGTKGMNQKNGTKPQSRVGKKGTQKDKKCDTSAPSTAPTISLEPSTGPSTSPSAEPTTSSEPSNIPSKLPSQSPSLTPSRYPSSSPSISHQPSASAEPSSIPSLEASLVPSPEPFSPWCLTVANGGGPPETGRAVNGRYYFKMVYRTNDSRTLQDILDGLDDTILRDLVKDHVWCGQAAFKGKNLRSLSLNRESPGHIDGLRIQTNSDEERRSLLIDGISLNGPDECQSPSNSNPCQTFKGEYTLYLRDDPLTSMSDGEAKEAVLGTISDGMNPNGGTLVSRNEGIDELIFYGENPDVQNREVGSGNINDNQPMAKIGLSSIGYTMIAVGSVITVIFVFAATRKRNRHRIERMEEFYEEEQDLFGKGIGLDDLDGETDLMSTDSARRYRNVHILGDGDSQYNGELYGVGRYHSSALGPEANQLGQRGDALDVHKCTSATCPICTRRLANPTFVKSMFPIDLNGAKPRGYAAPDTVDM